MKQIKDLLLEIICSDEPNPLDMDTDDDGLWDGSLCPNGGEDKNNNVEVDYDSDDNPTESDPLNHDSDGDQLWDGDEVNPVSIQRDKIYNTMDYTSSPIDADTDDDGLFDDDEFAYSANPTISDSDGDNLDDKTEVDIGSDPVGMINTPPPKGYEPSVA